MRIIFLGTGPFAVPVLQRLEASRHDVVCAVSRPPKGRRAAPTPVQTAAEELGIDVWLPDSVNSKTACTQLTDWKADLLVVCDYGEILKPPVLASSRLGGINLHGSLLPKYRGAAPVQWAILNGDEETGNTVIQMTPGLDAGPCLAVERIAIDPDETAVELEARMAKSGAELVVKVVDQLETGSATPVAQDKSKATKAPRLTKQQGDIDWSRSANEIKNLVRALQPWPRAFTHWQRPEADPIRLIIHRVAVEGEDASQEPAVPGEIVRVDRGLLVATGKGVLRLQEVQPAGKRKMTAEEFLNGHLVHIGDRLAEEGIGQKP